jgi:hypothetical protein
LHGGAVVISEIPSSSRAPSRHFRYQLLDESWRARRLIERTALDVNVRQLIELKFWTILLFLAFARKVGMFGIPIPTD